jgi:hypothetical protein
VPLRPLTAVIATVTALLAATFAAPAAVAAPGDPAGIARVSAIYALTAPESRTGLLDANSLSLYTSPTGALTRDLDAVIDTAVAIGIDPMILASIRVLGTAAPQTAIDWLERLEGATNQTFALGYADADITVALQAGSPTVVTPTSFDYAIDPTRFAPVVVDDDADTDTATPTPGPTPSPTPSATPQLPTAESLVAWDYTVPTIAWPVAGTVMASDLATIDASGYTTTILSSGNVERSERGQATATVADSSTIVTDDPLSTLLNEAVEAPTTEGWQSTVALLQAALDASALEGGPTGATTVLALERGSLGSATKLGITLDAIEALPSTNLTPFSATLAVPPSPATIIERPQTPARVASAASLLATEASDASFATVAQNPVLITGERRLRLLATMSTSWNTYPGGWGSAIDLYLAESVDLHESVRVVKSSDINLIADRASLPVTVKNSLNQPVMVNILVTAPTPLLEIEQPSVAVTIEPDSQKRAQIPVQSLSNGSAQISVSVTSGTGVPIGTPTSVKINVYAGWETPITFALSFLVFAVFAFGIARLVVRRRRARKERLAAESAVDAPEEATE